MENESGNSGDFDLGALELDELFEKFQNEKVELEKKLEKILLDNKDLQNDLKESNSKLFLLVKAIIEALKSRENEMSVTLSSMESERNGLLTKLEELEIIENNRRNVLKEWEDEKVKFYLVKDELANKVNDMITKVDESEKKLDEQENVITGRLVKVGFLV